MGSNKQWISTEIEKLPLIPVLRGLTPGDAASITKVLIEIGLKAIEITLDSPAAFESLRLMAKVAKEMETDGHAIFIGAGTVLSATSVRAVKKHGGKFVATPNVNIDVLRACSEEDIFSLSGVFTPTEAHLALGAKADALKLFPACVLGEKGIKTLRAVLPSNVPLFAMGGVTALDFQSYLQAGCLGFGIGGELYCPFQNAVDTGKKARTILQAYKKAKSYVNP